VSRNKLLDLLVERMGREAVEFIIPHPLLPPRYRRECKDRNLIVTFDIENTIQLRWENARLTSWMSPTPGEFRVVVAYALKKMEQYRRDLRTFGNFVDRVAEQPFQDPIFDDADTMVEPKLAEKKGSASKGSIPGVRFPFMGGGGESPLPAWAVF